MSDEWEGYPQNPERDGMHLLRYRLTGHLTGWYWNAKTERFHHEHITLGRAALLERYIYEGPILTPAEVAAREEAVRQEEREICKKLVLTMRDAWRKRHGQREGVAYAEAIAVIIGARNEV